MGVMLFFLYKGSPPFLQTNSHDQYFSLIKNQKFRLFWQAHDLYKDNMMIITDKYNSAFSDMFKDLI